MPPLAIKDMTWKTIQITHNIMVGDEPDDHDLEDDSEANTEGSGGWFSPYCTDNDSSTDTSDETSYHGTLSSHSQSADTPKSVVPADLPLLPPIRDGHDVPEKGSIIFSNASFEIRLTLNAGWGAFAKKKLFQGDKILVERALYHATFEEVQSSVRQLPEHEKKVANSLHAYYGRCGESKEEAIWSTNACVNLLKCRFKVILLTRSKTLSTDVAGLFPVAARFNHSCEPMVEYKYCAKEEVLVFTVRAWEVEEGQELTISYGKDPSVLYYRFGFNCSCGYCSGFDESKWNF
ncbi:set domain-containing protein 5 [Colletotrichum truncatum]|uniref:Set domain-containing protein 5 n=1 Tax=Colletotrichum truncatum TaxID=5467 RepID=A0ACC3YS30_COLTU